MCKEDCRQVLRLFGADSIDRHEGFFERFVGSWGGSVLLGRIAKRSNPHHSLTRRLPMAQPIYKVFMGKYTEAWYQRSKEEQDDIFAKNMAAFERLGSTVFHRFDNPPGLYYTPS